MKSDEPEKVIREHPFSGKIQNWRRVWGLEIHPTVFFVSAGLILSFVALSVLNHGKSEAFFAAVQSHFAHNFGWFYIVAVDLFLLFVLFLMVSPFGKIRLGGQ